MRVWIASVGGILLALSPLPPGTAASAEWDARRPEEIQQAIKATTCVGASTTKPASLPGTILQDVPIAVPSGKAVFYVSPDGDDAWSGLLPSPNRQRTDGPFATIEKARDAARKKKGESTIAMGEGHYYLSQPVVFDSRDAGLVVAARCGETPVLHGGPLVKRWTAHPDGRWTAALNLHPDQWLGDLFVDGVLQTKARFPNAPADGDPRKGWLFAARCGPEVDAWQGNTRFCFHPDDLPFLRDVRGLVVHIVGGFHPGSQWGSDTLPLVSIDSATRTVHTDGTGYFFTAEGSRYFLSGGLAFLDAPREWWHDPGAGQLSYMAPDGHREGASVVAAILPTFFKLDEADGMVVSGLQFRDGAPEGSGKFRTETRGYGAIRLERSDNVQLLGNIVKDVGVGIHVTESNDTLIAGNVIAGLAGNGIYLGTTYGSFGKSHRARILANHIRDIGRVYFESAGIWFQAGDVTRIAGNVIENAAQFGIIGGSLWGQQDAVHDAVVEHNLIRNANQRTADGGAIKMMGEQADLLDSRISDNIITGTGHLMNRADGTFWPDGYEDTSEWPTPISWAIYADGRASGLRIERNNLIGNVSAIGINGGWNNLVTDNIITHGSGAAFRIDDSTGRNWRPDWSHPNRIEDNIVSVNDHHGPVAYVHAPGHGAGYVHFARNRYKGTLSNKSFRIHPQTMPSGEFGSLDDLQKAGVDMGSEVMPTSRQGARR